MHSGSFRMAPGGGLWPLSLQERQMGFHQHHRVARFDLDVEAFRFEHQEKGLLTFVAKWELHGVGRAYQLQAVACQSC